MPLETTVTPGSVATAAGLGSSEAATTKAATAVEEALAHLELALERAFRTPAGPVLDGMVLIVAVAIATRNRAPGAGSQTTTVEDGSGVRVARDPLAGVRGTLARYTVGLA